jgi:ATP-dependent helicase HrpB
MAAFGLHPRLAHMLLRARQLGVGATACVVAALIEERDVLRGDATRREADLRLRVGLVAGDGHAEHHDVDRDAVRRVREQARAWRAQLGVRGDEAVDDEATGWLLALAYPDRVAQRRAGADERFLMRNGSGAVLDDAGALTGSSFLTVADLDGRMPYSRIYLAAPLERADLERLFASQIVREDVVRWDGTAGTVLTARRERLGSILLREAPLPDPDETEVARTLLDAIVRGDGVVLRWSESARQLRERLAFLHGLEHSVEPSWPDVSEAALRGTMEEWLLPRLVGLRRRAEVEQLDLGDVLRDLLTWEQRRALDRLAPTHVQVPTGSRIPVDYGDPAAPVLAVRLQELFGLAETPRIADGTVPLTLHLLSPARRPVQVTRDLAGFWRSSYFDVRKEMRGRYPKHEWPEDPLSATPTRRAKPRR